jgi:hypothetical protein
MRVVGAMRGHGTLRVRHLKGKIGNASAACRVPEKKQKKARRNSRKGGVLTEHDRTYNPEGCWKAARSDSSNSMISFSVRSQGCMLAAPPRPVLCTTPVASTGSRDRDRDRDAGLGCEETMLPLPPRPLAVKSYAMETFSKTLIGINSNDSTYRAGVVLMVDSGYQVLIVSVPPTLRSHGRWRGAGIPRTGGVPGRRPNVSGTTTTSRS